MQKKILLVEDNLESRETLALMLKRIGCLVIEAENSKDAIQCAIAESPDLILMDLGLPDVDGVQTTTVLKRNPETSGIPVVALMSWFHEMWQQKAIEAGVAEFLTKPALPVIVKEVVGRFTQRASYDFMGRFPDRSKSYG